MSTTTVKHPFDGGFAQPERAASGNWFSRNFSGLATGFRAYRIYGDLEAMTDNELAARGLERKDLARAAMDQALATGRA